jgi:hypothetical protein
LIVIDHQFIDILLSSIKIFGGFQLVGLVQKSVRLKNGMYAAKYIWGIHQQTLGVIMSMLKSSLPHFGVPNFWTNQFVGSKCPRSMEHIAAFDFKTWMEHPEITFACIKTPGLEGECGRFKRLEHLG